MSLAIYIPTYRRVNNQLTWNRLPEDWKQRTTMVCVADEKVALSKACPGSAILIQPERITTIAKKRQWIVQQCPHDKLVMLDDDLRLCVRKNGLRSGKYPGDVALIQADKASQSHLFFQIERELNTYTHVGVSMRMGNQSREPGWHENKRMCYVLAYRTETVRRFARFDELAHREDMLVTLRLLQAGFPNSVTHLWAADQIYNKAGGESAAGRSMEASNADAYRLAKLFPKLVKTTVKKYKVSVPRVEVAVQWIKAFNEVLS